MAGACGTGSVDDVAGVESTVADASPSVTAVDVGSGVTVVSAGASGCLPKANSLVKKLDIIVYSPYDNAIKFLRFYQGAYVIKSYLYPQLLIKQG